MSTQSEVERPATKLVVVVDETLAIGPAVNAATVLGLAVGARLTESLGADGKDASGGVHLGLNTHPVPVVTAGREQLRELHRKSTERPDLLVVGFNEVARQARVYEDYLATLAETPAEDIDYAGVAVFGPRNRVTALTKRFPLL
ncbi:DUF2000 domain-containing protein [Actinoplanes sp. M2I2]|uniref:DUF2000 domain-containing protein n=1 Tax=Actinoplanes sp. M2I2 TaxID=1734444 RepID=UPI00202002B8|nr:DUF2000 domain-containing protein [Actinoplanes sp. M2I2]